MSLYEDMICEILDSFTESKMMEWYDEYVIGCHLSHTDLLYDLNYPNILPIILDNAFDKTLSTEDKVLLADHENATEGMRIKMYEISNDTKYLSAHMDSVFLF